MNTVKFPSSGMAHIMCLKILVPFLLSQDMHHCSNAFHVNPTVSLEVTILSFSKFAKLMKEEGIHLLLSNCKSILPTEI